MAFKHGVDDLVLLTDISEDGIRSTLKSRYMADQIYTNIGNVLIACNPYRLIDGLYGPKRIKSYQNRYPFEEPPHVYATAEALYSELLSTGINQAVIITGESGSGKTETSKRIMEYVAAVTGKSKNVQRVKDMILDSNPLLESFGNAKTVQNNNSSRFGKYFEIQFDYSGDPTGGTITNYLLEKSRIVRQAADERNFHIFYEAVHCVLKIAGGALRSHGITDPNSCKYLNQSGCTTIQGVNDSSQFKECSKAMTTVGIDNALQDNVWQLLAAILKLGNLTFKGGGKAAVEDRSALANAAKLLGVTDNALEAALVTRSVATNQEKFASQLNADQAAYSRDSLARALYSALFDWIVMRINSAMEDNSSEFSIGVLDIYGFEIFKHNSLEQLMINLVNEKLQQVFIELTLKSEQEEYVREGIEWKQIEYFQNKPCVDLIEGKGGIFALLDEDCIMPNSSDKSFIEKVSKHVQGKKQFDGADTSKNQFTMTHYAGQVTYTVDGFIDKNKDTLFANIKETLSKSSFQLVAQMFPSAAVASKKRPPTAATIFKSQVAALVQTLTACTPHYIRCIRSNSTKSAKKFEDELCGAQVRYLGLLENVRVRRAGFAYRQSFELFLRRYKMCARETWPFSDKMNPQDACRAILNAAGVQKDGAYVFGKTKVFIRQPQTLMALEELRAQKLEDIVRIIQRKWRACRGKAFYKRLRQTSAQVFHGNKERRRMTLVRRFEGDYMNAQIKGPYLGIRKKWPSEKRLLFASKMTKVNLKGKLQERVVMITNESFYAISTIRKKIKRRVPIRQLESIQMSSMADGIFVLNVKNEHSMVWLSQMRTEAVVSLVELYKELTESLLPTIFDDKFDYKQRKGMLTLEFAKDESVPPMKEKVAKSGNTIKVSVATGLPKDSGPSRKRFEEVEPKRRFINATGKGAKAPGTLFQATALHDHVPKNARDLAFKKGDTINVTKKDIKSGVWHGMVAGSSKTGTFPAEYVSENK